MGAEYINEQRQEQWYPKQNKKCLDEGYRGYKMSDENSIQKQTFLISLA